MKAWMEEGCNGFALLDVLLNDRPYILGLHTTIPGIVGQHADGGSHVALSLTAAANDHSTRHRGCLKSCQHSSRAICKTISVLADENLTTRIHTKVMSFE